MNDIYNIEGEFNGLFKIEYLPCVNYSMVLNSIHVCTNLSITNTDSNSWKFLKMTCNGTHFAFSECNAPSLSAGETVHVTNFEIIPDIESLKSVEGKVRTVFTVNLDIENTRVFSKEFSIDLLGYNYWTGVKIMPELISSFVNSHHSAAIKLCEKAVTNLTCNPTKISFDAYQTQDTQRVIDQISAIYHTFKTEGIELTSDAIDFSQAGIEVKSCDQVLEGKKGNSLDISLCFASCLESVGIFPILILLNNQALLGIWLIEDIFKPKISDDITLLRKECFQNRNLLVIDVKSVTSSVSASFESAVNSGVELLNADDNFNCFIDVVSCRTHHIRSLPERRWIDGKWVELASPDSEESTFDAKLDRQSLKIENSAKAVTKQTIWERKLLDFSLRNNLLNMKLGKRVLQLVSFQSDQFEDEIENGREFRFTPYPGKPVERPNGVVFHSDTEAKEQKEFINKELDNGRFVSYLGDTELKDSLKFLYRTSRTALEENGANSLFITFGLLQWYENEKSLQPRYAPLLLLPVEMIRKNGQAGFVIRIRDEEIFLNTTLTELIKQQFKIDFHVLNPLPKDESGVDVKLIFSQIKELIKELNRWDVLEEICLGLFSFNKFVMWNDIHANADKLRSNPIINTLMGEMGKWELTESSVDVRESDASISPSQFAIPLDVDSSQMEAIIASGEGKSFILHGPPGTGKSQTITNMIANALYQGKRVLFVAEKMAALSVVQKRLAKIGLDPFCLELHSNKVTKNHFLTQMQSALDAAHIKSDEEFRRSSEQLFDYRKKLIKYIESLHRKQQCGYSLHDSISNYLSLTGDEIKDNLPAIEMLTKTNIENWANEILELNTIFRISGHPADSVLRGFEPKDSSSLTFEQLKKLLAQYSESLVKVVECAAHFFSSNLPDLSKISYADLIWQSQISRSLIGYNRLKGSVLSTFDTGILDVNPVLLKQEWGAISDKWFLMRFFAQRKFLKKLRVYNPALKQTEVDKLLTDLQTISGYKKNIISEFGNDPRYLNEVDINKLKELVELNDKLEDLNKQITAFADLVLPHEFIYRAAPDCINSWIDHYSDWNDWCQWIFKKRSLISQGLNCVVDYIHTTHADGSKASASMLKGVYHKIIMNIVDSDVELRMFNGLLIDDLIKKYRQEAANFQEFTKKELYCRLANNVPVQTMEAVSNSEMGILKRNIANGGRGMSIRRIMDEIPTLLPRLCPCMLMSPISVAQFIDLDAPKFDLVIFDEASQMPTSESVGAIARGKSLVVVGDPKQMPPTSFFDVSMVDEEESSLDDMESILDDCIAMSIPSYYLTWHYRSKHESLISFSNANFYDGKLFTFPSVDNRISKVKLIPVEGIYDKGRTRSNKSEADAIVKEVLRRLKDDELSKFSIGIVSFSQAQQNLIEDMLTEALAEDPSLEAKAFGGEEPVFIKNLENVQGDERDIILFSVGYGPDKNGNLSMNFGPLNNEGGERRLNVAVTRARYEMLIFSTLKAEQIDLRRTQAKGVIGLKKFLEFAAQGNVGITSAMNAEINNESELVIEIANEIRKRGYRVDTLVGKSEFRIDVAVLDPHKEETYMLAVLVDGKNYYATKTTRDREICQPSVLKMLHWDVMRVWMMDWYLNREKVISRIMERIEALSGKSTRTIDDKKLLEDKIAPTVKFDLSEESNTKTAIIPSTPYVYAKISPFRGTPALEKVLSQPERVLSQVQNLVVVEQPITNTLLYKRILEIWKLKRMSTSLQSLIDDCLVKSHFYLDPISNGQVNVYWANAEKANAFNVFRTDSDREINDIPLNEMMVACVYAIEQQISIGAEDLKKIVSQLFGLSRRSASSDAMVQKAVDELLRIKKIQLHNDKLSLST